MKRPRPLEPKDTVYAARELIRRGFTLKGVQTLRFHKGEFWIYSEGAYHPWSDEECEAIILLFLEKSVDPGESRRFQPTVSTVRNVRAALQSLCMLETAMEAPAWLQGAPPDLVVLNPCEMMSVRNGLLHVPSGTLHAPTPTYFCTSAAGISYDVTADAPTAWLKFLDDLFGDDEEAIRALQEWFGYMLTPVTSFHKILLLIGPKRAGKSTIGRVLRAMLGEGNVGSLTFAALYERFGLQPLIGKPCCLIPDARMDPRKSGAAPLERLLSISGEDTVTIDRKYRDPWVGKMSTRFAIISNDMPHLPDASGALVARLLILRLRKSFEGSEDSELFERLLKEMPGILNWSIEGYRRLYERKRFVQPASSDDIVSDMGAMSSPVKAFVEDRCVIGPTHFAPKEHLFKAWRSHCVKTGNQPGTIETFGRDLRSVVPELGLSRPTVNGERVRMYTGIALADRATAGASDDPKIVRLSRTS